VPILALTATATAAVAAEVADALRLEGAEVFRASVDRPNLFYEVVPKPAAADALTDDLAAWIRRNYLPAPAGVGAAPSGVVCTLSRREAEALAAALGARGVAAAAYHAEMAPEARAGAHEAWAAGAAQVVVATLAFGMGARAARARAPPRGARVRPPRGSLHLNSTHPAPAPPSLALPPLPPGINKVEVRFVAHASLPKSLENYCEFSRALGRLVEAGNILETNQLPPDQPTNRPINHSLITDHCPN
jgi:superfamily II DNA/RNA helicase